MRMLLVGWHQMNIIKVLSGKKRKEKKRKEKIAFSSEMGNANRTECCQL